MNDDDRYFWKDRQLDPDSRRTFECILWMLVTAGFVLIVWLVV